MLGGIQRERRGGVFGRGARASLSIRAGLGGGGGRESGGAGNGSAKRIGGQQAAGAGGVCGTDGPGGVLGEIRREQLEGVLGRGAQASLSIGAGLGGGGEWGSGGAGGGGAKRVGGRQAAGAGSVESAE